MSGEHMKIKSKVISIRFKAIEIKRLSPGLKKCNLKLSSETCRILILEGLKYLSTKKETMAEKTTFEDKLGHLEDLLKGVDYDGLEKMINKLKEAQIPELERMDHIVD